MTEQQQHLQQMIKQQTELLKEIQSITIDVTTKRELALKLQGAIEYLQQIGVNIPVPEKSEENTEEETVSAE